MDDLTLLEQLRVSGFEPTKLEKSVIGNPNFVNAREIGWPFRWGERISELRLKVTGSVGYVPTTAVEHVEAALSIAGAKQLAKDNSTTLQVPRSTFGENSPIHNPSLHPQIVLIGLESLRDREEQMRIAGQIRQWLSVRQTEQGMEYRYKSCRLALPRRGKYCNAALIAGYVATKDILNEERVLNKLAYEEHISVSLVL